MKNNYNYLIKIRFHKFYLIMILLILLVLGIYFYNKDTYDIYNTYFIFENNSMIINVDMNNSDVVEKGHFVKIDKKYYDYQIINKSSLLENNNINYYEYEISINKLKYKYDEVKEITFYYNKERVLKKILKIII